MRVSPFLRSIVSISANWRLRCALCTSSRILVAALTSNLGFCKIDSCRGVKEVVKVGECECGYGSVRFSLTEAVSNSPVSCSCKPTYFF